jgi:hypothetical protein
MKRVLIVGLDPPESKPLSEQLNCAVIATPALPRIKVQEGVLMVERPSAAGQFLPVSHVIYHGIFEDDFDFITTLALWDGPVLPNARGMMDCRQRVPCLIRALRATRYGSAARSFADRGVRIDVMQRSVAKWGQAHCGEGKSIVETSHTCEVPTLVEPFVEGTAVRIMLIGERAWQIRLSGTTWLKSIHADDAAFVPQDDDLVADARSLAAHFELELAGIDYIVDPSGQPHLLEVNHIPNVDRLAELREAYLAFAAEWTESVDASV